MILWQQGFTQSESTDWAQELTAALGAFWGTNFQFMNLIITASASVV